MRELWSIPRWTTAHVPTAICKIRGSIMWDKRQINQPMADTFIFDDAPGAQWSVYVDFLHGESGTLRKTGAQGAAGGSGSEASFHDLTSTRSLRRDLGSCCWNKGSDGVRLCSSVLWGSRRFPPPFRPPLLAPTLSSSSARALILTDASSS